MIETTKNLAKQFARLGTIASAILLGVTGVSLTACNTTEGAGRDIEAAGEGIQDMAD